MSDYFSEGSLKPLKDLHQKKNETSLGSLETHQGQLRPDERSAEHYLGPRIPPQGLPEPPVRDQWSTVS